MPVWPCAHLGLGWFRKSRAQRRVRAAPVVVDLEFLHVPPQVAFVQRNQEVETLAADGPYQTLTMGIRLRRPNRRLEDPDAKALQFGIQIRGED